jgi:hypothetical protein
VDVYGCYVGTDRNGVAAAGNHDGIVLVGGHSQQIGGAGSDEGNVISGNTRYGVHLSGTAYVQVLGNLIGTDLTGMADVGNVRSGVRVDGVAEYNRIGGAGAGTGNLISGNGNEGVLIGGIDARYNRVYGNTIGTTLATTRRLPNGDDGVRIVDGLYNEVGGALAGQGNLISGNGRDGVRLQGAEFTTVAGNNIGRRGGGGSTGNYESGVHLMAGARLNTIGPDNEITNNDQDGVLVEGAATVRNTITRNIIWQNWYDEIDLGSGRDIANEGIEAPIIIANEPDHAAGLACPRCTVEVFSGSARDAETYYGTVTALATGEWRWDAAREHSWFTATATDSRGNTSEFSICYDFFEINDDFDEAAEIEAATSYYAGICRRSDEDFFVVEAAAGEVLTAELDSRQNYRLRLYGPDRTLLAEEGTEGDSGLRRITHTVGETGGYFLRVDGFGRLYSPRRGYRIEVGFASLDTNVRPFLDEGSLSEPAVYKLIPDTDGPADVTYVDVVAELSTNGYPDQDPFVTVEIPGDAFGAPVLAETRDCTECTASPASFVMDGPGRYGAVVPLTAGGPLQRQLVLRFAIDSIRSPGDVVPTVEVSYGDGGDVVATADAPPIRLVREVDAIVITNRGHLYDNHNDGQVVELLDGVTTAAQGPPDGPSGSVPAAVYFVDDYSTEAQDWNNWTWDPASEATANVAARQIDEFLDDWIDDAVWAEYVMILGDDDVIPFFRRECPCDGAESGNLDGVTDALLLMVVSNDYIFTDNIYGDTDRHRWSRGRLERSVGRIVGDTARDMRRLFEAGLAGPAYDTPARAVLASWDMSDLAYGGSGGVLGWVRDWGFTASSDMVDNDRWDEGDLIGALRDQFSLFIHADHGTEDSVCAPPVVWLGDPVCVSAGNIAMAIDHTVERPLRPFVGLGDCRPGFTLVSGGVVDVLINEGSSGVVTNAGISYFGPEDMAWWTEEIFNEFWWTITHHSDWSVGRALRWAKEDYYPDWGWYCWDLTAAQEITLYGVPWMRITAPVSKAMPLNDTANSVGPKFGVAKALQPGTYEVTTVVDAGTYSIDTESVPGFDLVEVEGFDQRPAGGPVVPGTTLELPLPAGAEIVSVDLTTSNPVQLGTLSIPWYTPAIKLYPGGVDEKWEQTPASAGTVPAEQFTWDLDEGSERPTLFVGLCPIEFDAAAGQTTLHRQLEVRVVYETPEPVTVTDFGTSSASVPPGATVATSAQVVNVIDESASLMATLRVSDLAGQEIETATEGPFTIEAGETQDLSLSCPAPDDEGSYSVELELQESGEVVARARAMVAVSGGHIAEFLTPDRAVPHTPVEFTVVYANATDAPVDATFELDVLDIAGRVEDELESMTLTVAAGGQETVSWSWDARVVPLGLYQLQATVTPGAETARSKVRLIDTRRVAARPRHPLRRRAP